MRKIVWKKSKWALYLILVSRGLTPPDLKPPLYQFTASASVPTKWETRTAQFFPIWTSVRTGSQEDGKERRTKGKEGERRAFPFSCFSLSPPPSHSPDRRLYPEISEQLRTVNHFNFSDLLCRLFCNVFCCLAIRYLMRAHRWRQVMPDRGQW